MNKAPSLCPVTPDNVDNVDDEGKELHAYAATSISTTASPLITSVGLDDLGSPQGLKRPIGEVDTGSVDSSNVTGTFWIQFGWFLDDLVSYTDGAKIDVKRQKL